MPCPPNTPYALKRLLLQTFGGGRPVSPQVQEMAYRSGLMVLLSLMVFVTFNDLSSFGLWRSLSGLIG